MKRNLRESNKINITNEKKILEKYNKFLNKIFIFLDKYVSSLIQNNVEFEYINSIKLYDKVNKGAEVELGNILSFNFETKTLSIIHKKVYIPYYNENKLIYTMKFEEIGFDNLRNILIIKYLTLLKKNNAEIYGVKNFPKLVIANKKQNSIVDKNNLDKLETIFYKLKIGEEAYSEEKYCEVIKKYNKILLDFYKSLKLDNIYYKILCKKISFYEHRL